MSKWRNKHFVDMSFFTSIASISFVHSTERVWTANWVKGGTPLECMPRKPSDIAQGSEEKIKDLEHN